MLRRRRPRSRACSARCPRCCRVHSLFTIARSPPAFVPLKPTALSRADHVGDQRMARIALSDVEAGVRGPARVRVVELSVVGAVGEDPVVAVVVRREVRAPVAVDVVPVEAVQREPPRRQVLDRDAVGVEHRDPVPLREVAVQDRAVAIHSPDRQVRRRDGDRLVVDAGCDQHQPSRPRMVDALLDRREVLRHAHRRREPRRRRFAAGAHVPARSREIDAAHQHRAGHADARASRGTCSSRGTRRAS